MTTTPLWITGTACSGKTTRLVKEFCHWVTHTSSVSVQPVTASCLVFAANDDNRRILADQLAIALPQSSPIVCKTFLGFISEEVTLFFPLLFEQMPLNAQFPLRLRPETEQALATQLWRSQMDSEQFSQSRLSEYRFVRQTLDLLQLAGASGITPEEIPSILAQGFPQTENLNQVQGNLIMQWRQWCLERGLLTYGLIYELYWRYLLPHPQYQYHLTQRYRAIFADDVDDYPAIFQDFCNFFLIHDAFGVFTYNPDGQVRLGLNADPYYVAKLAENCEIIELYNNNILFNDLAEPVTELATNPFGILSFPDTLQSIQTPSRAALLRKTADYIIHCVKQDKIQPEEIAIIAPGLDDIARYSLLEILGAAKIPIEPLNEQRSLIGSPLIRALLTLLGLVYSGLGRWVLRDDVAEMLVVLSQAFRENTEANNEKLTPDIDPVRAGLIADYCYHIDPENPRLLSVETFPRWDRLGHRAVQSYQQIVQWIEKTKADVEKHRFIRPILVLDRAISDFLGKNIPYEQLSAVRELMETTQHYWEVDHRVRQYEPNPEDPIMAIAHFIQLLRRGTITANPRPLRSLSKKQGSILLATIFQYRSLRSSHRWQFWLDAGSPLWEKGGASTLYGAELFLRNWSGGQIRPEEEFETDQARLKRILRDLLGRVQEKVILCHSDLSVRGTEQTGALLTLVAGAKEIALNSLAET